MGDGRRKKGRKIGDYVVLKKIGQGQFGKVFLAQNEKTGAKMALKQLKIEQIARDEDLRRNFKSELSIMHKIHHPNVIRCEEFYESEHHYYVLMEYCNQGTLEFLNSPRRPKVSLEKCAEYWLQIKEGFRALRKAQVIHRDVKLENLLLKDGILKIADFGVARFGLEACNTTMVGTLLTMAPEVMNPRAALPEAEAHMLDSKVELEYTSKVDLWSVGVVYYEILFGDFPFFGFNPSELIHNMKTKSGKQLKIPKKIPAKLEDLLKSLLVFDPNKRISWEEYFKHPAFENYPLPSHLNKVYPHLVKKKKSTKMVTSLYNELEDQLHSRRSLEDMMPNKRDMFVRKDTMNYLVESNQYEDSSYFLYSNTPTKENKGSLFFSSKNKKNERKSERPSKMERIEETEMEHTPKDSRRKIKRDDVGSRGSNVRSTLKALQRRKKSNNPSKKKTDLQNKIRQRAIDLSRNMSDSIQNLIISRNPSKNNFSITNYAIVNDGDSTKKTMKRVASQSLTRKETSELLNRKRQTENRKRDMYKKRYAPSRVEIENSNNNGNRRNNGTLGMVSIEREKKKRESGIKRLIKTRKRMRSKEMRAGGSRLGRRGLFREEAVKNKVLGNSTHLVEAESSKRAGIRRDSNTDSNTKQQLKNSQVEVLGRMVAHRYSHEKNKVMFIHLSIKKTRELIKLKINPDIQLNLYLTIILMMRKAAVLTDMTLQSLVQKINIFDEPEFDSFLLSRSYSDMVNEFSNDLPNFKAYSTRLMAWALASAPELKPQLRRMEILERSSEKIRSGLYSVNTLQELDSLLKVQFSLLKSFPIDGPKQGSYYRISLKVKRLFVMTLVKLKYSIFCEKFFPYKSGDSFFDWKLFFNTFKSISVHMLRKLAGI